MRRVSPLRSLTAVLLLVVLLWAAAILADSHTLVCAILVPLWWVVALVSIRIARGAEEASSAQPLALAAGLSPRAPPAARNFLSLLAHAPAVPTSGEKAMKHTFRELLLLYALGLGSLIGVPMRAEEIEELMRQINVPKVAHTVREESEKPDWLKKLERLLKN